MLARRPIQLLLMLAVALLVVSTAARPAEAVILPAVTIDGPDEAIVGFGNVAMADDGTGGLVYLKRVEGITHVFVARYIGGHWLAPIRVDTGEQFAASWPRIGAADGGELIVVWATPFATEGERPVDELLGATLGSGSSTFGRAIMIDRDILDATGTSPSLAVSSTGQADVVYRVVNNELTAEQATIPLLHPGDVIEDVRVAHYNGQRWSNLGAINRSPGISMRPPTEVNAPKIAIGPTGNGVAAWQEPDIDGVARIWARRLFGASLDYVLPVSATSYQGTPINDDADAPSVAVSQLGQVEVAYRQDVGPGSPLPGPRIFLNVLPDGESASGAEFLGASVADSEVAGGGAATVGPPSIDIDEKQDLRLLYDDNGSPRVITGNDRGLSGALTLGPAFSSTEQAAASVMGPSGGGISAWPSATAGGVPAVAVREDFPGGAVQTGLVSAGGGGEVSELAVGRSGLGDGIVAFRQGPFGNASIVASETSAPPAQFPLNAPKGWVRPSRASVSWERASSANGPLSYTVVLDGRALATPPGSFSMKLSRVLLGDGTHRLQVLATDADGQATLTPPVSLKVDGEAPIVHATATRRDTVSVRISDPNSGVNVRVTTINFGDGESAHGSRRFRHRYSHAGIYQIVAHVRDLVGNSATVRQFVSVR